MDARKSVGRIVLYPGVVGEYEGAYDFINESEWGRAENIPGYHEGGIGDHSFYVYEVVEVAPEAKSSDEPASPSTAQE